MPTSFLIQNAAATNNNTTTNSTTISVGSTTSYIAQPWWAYESQTVNRIYFRGSTVTNPTRFNLMVGIGSIDRSTGLPFFVGAGTTLNFISSTKVTTSTVTDNEYFVAIPDMTTTQLGKYYLGIATTDNTGAGILNIHYKWSNNIEDTLNPTSLIINGATDQQYGTDRFHAFNWGYDPGTAVTTWYNPFPGPNVADTVVNTSLTNLCGFTFTYDNDIDQIYVENVKVVMRAVSNGANGLNSSFGCTFHSVLYDSDGTTALVAHTMGHYTSNATNAFSMTFPINTWINKNKLYHFTFAGTTAGASLRNNFMQYSFQSNGSLGFTSIFFTKSSGSAAPSYNSNKIIPFFIMITDMRSSVQNSEGNLSVF